MGGLVNCPYCNEEVCDIDREYYENGYDSIADTYWDEYRVKCPNCGKEFRWFENYVRVEDDVMKMED